MVEISVIMPVSDTKEEYLHEAIRSVLNQTFKDFEFLILNDSPDNKQIQRIISDYSDERIKYMENPKNIGIPQSYNKLKEMATGKYIAIMNHDDIMSPRRLATQYRYMEKHPEVGLLGTGYKKFGEINRFKRTQNPKEHEQICAYLLFKSAVHHPTIMMRRQVMAEHKIRYNENFISLNDRLLCCEFSKYSKLANLPDILYKYRFHTNMTSKRCKETIRHERSMFHKLWFAYNNIELTPEEVNIFDNYTTYGRQKICDLNTLKIIVSTLEKLSEINKQRHLLEPDNFTDICAKYATKRCLNALVRSRINIKDIINHTKLPVNKPLLLGSNIILGWKKPSF